MTDDRHMDETQPDQTVPEDSSSAETGIAGLPMQPTGSGVADEQAAYEQSERDGSVESPVQNQ